MRISIPEPCHENWQNMLPSEKGRFCLSCQKEVVDFSVMTKHEIETYFKSLPNNVCGRFKGSQLTDINRELPAVNNKLSLKPWWMAASLFVFAKSSISQGNNLAIDSTKQNVELNKDVGKTKKEVVDKEIYKYIIKGKVVDKETGESLPFVSVTVDTLKIGTTTDFDGCFTMSIPENNIDSVIISFSYLGYEDYDTMINSDAEIAVGLVENVVVMGGAIFETTISKPSIWRRIGYFFARPFRRRH